MTRAAIVTVLALACAPATSRGETVLRLSTVAPEGSAWAHEMRAVAREIEQRTDGRVRIKWYFGSIAGGDLEQGERLKRGQLEGVVSGGPLCSEVMPSLRIAQFPGLFRDASEARYIVNQLSVGLGAEAERAGFVDLGATLLGFGVYLGHRPVASFADLRKQRIWVWDAETILAALFRAMGLEVVAAPVDRAAREFDAGHTDGFWALPTAALAFQWSAQASYLVDLRGEFLFGCVLVASRAFNALGRDDQLAVRAAAAQMRDRIDEVSRKQEEALLGGMFQHQGVKVIEPSEQFRTELWAAAAAARDRIGTTLIAPGLLLKVRTLLSDYRTRRAAATAH